MIRNSTGVYYLSELDIMLIVLWTARNKLFHAVLSLGKVLLGQVHVAQFEPRLFVILVNFQILVQNKNGIILQIVVSEE